MSSGPLSAIFWQLLKKTDWGAYSNNAKKANKSYYLCYAYEKIVKTFRHLSLDFSRIVDDFKMALKFSAFFYSQRCSLVLKNIGWVP